MASFIKESSVHLPESSSSENGDEIIIENPTETSNKRGIIILSFSNKIGQFLNNYYLGKDKQYHFHESFETLELAENSLEKNKYGQKLGKKDF